MSSNSYEPPDAASKSEPATGPDPATGRRVITAFDVLRSVGGVIGGIIVAVAVLGTLEWLGHKIYPPPPGIDIHDPEAIKTIIGHLPLGAIIMVLVAWGAGSLAGAFTAAAIARRKHVRHGLIVGGVIMAFAGLTMIMIPHPIWFMFAAAAVIVLPAWLGAVGAKRLFDRSNTVGPKPYDMRKKNMAC